MIVAIKRFRCIHCKQHLTPHSIKCWSSVSCGGNCEDLLLTCIIKIPLVLMYYYFLATIKKTIIVY